MSYIGDGDAVGDWNPSGIQWTGQHSGMVQFGNPNSAVVVFYRRSVINPILTERAGERKYENIDYVRVQHPGEKEQVVDRPVQPTDKKRWPQQWNAYAAGREQTPVGIPIDLLFPAHPAIADNLKVCNILTVEQLAGLSSSGMDTIGMGAQDYVNYAKQYMEVAHRGVGFHQMQAELKTRDAEITTLKNQIALQTAKIDELISIMTSKGSQVPAGFAPSNVAKAVQGGLPPLPAQFDAQTSAINATHESHEIADTKLKKSIPRAKRSA